MKILADQDKLSKMRTEQHEALNSEEFNEEEEEPVFEDAQSEIDDLDGLKVVGFHREVSFNPGFRASSNYEREHKMHLGNRLYSSLTNLVSFSSKYK